MMHSLYGDYKVPAAQEQTLRRKLKDILNSTPPNTTTLNKKAATDLPRYFSTSNETYNYMILNTGLEVKHKRIMGQASKLFLLFIRLNDGTYEYNKYYVQVDWYCLYETLATEFSLVLDYFLEDVDAEALAIKTTTEDNTLEEVATTVEQSVESEFTNSSLKSYYDEYREIIDNATLNIADLVATDSADKPDVMTNESEDSDLVVNAVEEKNDILVSEELPDVIEELSDETDISKYISNIMTSFRADSIMPPIAVFYACIKQNGIIIDANIMYKLMSRLVFMEWTDWLYTKITTTGLLTHSGKILIDTGFIKSDGQTLYSIVAVQNNYPTYLKLDCSLVDIKAAGLNIEDAQNLLTASSERLRDNPLSIDNIDFNTNKWKIHILEARQSRFGSFKNLDYDTRMNLVTDSIKHACHLETRGCSIKRLVRASTNHVSVAIPLRYKNSYTTAIAIILTLNKYNVWEISTIEAGAVLTNNIRTYNYYNMPCWLRQID